jgi:NAD(P) transhydrogenase
MIMQKFDMLVIGSGPGGQRAAVQAAKIGKSVALIEKAKDLGGVSINTGTLPSKTLREAVVDLSGSRERQLYGMVYRENTVTPDSLLSRARRVMAAEREVIRRQLHRNHVKLIPGAASFVSPHQVQVEGETYEASYIVIAVGTYPAVPAGITIDHETVLTSDDILQLQRLPRTLIVAGAGVIGTEYATMFSELGVDVTLVDKRSTYLEMVDDEVRDAFQAHLRERNVTFRMNEEVTRVEKLGRDRVVVHVKSGKRIAAEMLLVSSGRQGAVDQLGLEKAGIDADNRGKITVDANYRTAVPHIYAVGDVIGAPQLASTSAEQGRIAACHAFGIPAQSVPELFPYGIYSIPEIAWVGPSEEELTRTGVGYETGRARYREIARGQILGDEDGMLKIVFELTTRKLLAVWAMGEQATEVVHVGQAVMAHGGTLDYFLNNVFNYPTLAECYKVAALNGYNKLRGLIDLAPAPTSTDGAE